MRTIGFMTGGLRLTVASALAAAVALTVPGCIRETYYRGTNDAVYVQKQGPPPWAPAHGYRRKHPGGALLVYDAGLGCYAVEGHPSCYFQGNRFYCRRGGAWSGGPSLGGPWTVVSLQQLPPGLAKKWGAGPPPGHAEGHKHKGWKH